MRKKLSFLLVGLMLVSMMGCTAADQPTSKAKSGEVAEIFFWDMTWGPADLYKAAAGGIVGRFNDEHPGINVSYEMRAWDNYYQDYLTAVTSGSAPDVTNGGFTQSVQYAVMDELIDLDSIVEDWKESGFYDTFPAGSFELHQYEGKQVGIPWIQDPRMIVYNKEIFEQAGITKLPETWDEFYEALVAVKENTGVTPFAMAGIGTHSFQEMVYLLLSAGAGLTDAQGNANFNSPEAIKALEWVGKMCDEGLIAAGSAGYQAQDLDSLFATGQLAVMISAIPRGAMTDEFIDKIGVMPPFTMKAGMEKRGLTFVNPMVAYKQGKYPDASREFIKWYIENSRDLFTKGHAGFSASSAVNDDPFFRENPVYSQILDNVLPYSTVPTWPTPNLYPAFSQIEGELYAGMALAEVLSGGRDFEAIANKYNDMIAQAITDFAQ